MAPSLSWALLLGGLALAGTLAGSVAVTTPATAQFFRDDRFQPPRRVQRAPGFFDQLFGGGSRSFPGELERPVPVESSRAPAPKKYEGTPSLTVTVVGDSMADWLAYGLEEAFSDSPEIAVLRKAKINSGLLRYDPRSDLDWWHVARDLLAQEKTDYVVMMLGINDRQAIRESQLQKAADKAAKEAKEQGKPEEPEKKADDDEQPAIIAPEPHKGAVRGVIDFRSERWEEIYSKRIDETIAALKSKGTPVLWVGLPPLRGPRSTADVGYLNDLFRARAEKAGIVFVDVWDGFVDEAGKFTTFGPDFEGQTRRLRTGDGVHFTKAGARKLAHYVERELRRFMSNRAMPIALPSDGGAIQAPGAAGPAVRPIAGPVLPLTATPSSGEELLGGGATRPVHSDPTATRVLVKGEPLAPPRGRADDFTWPRPGDAANIEPLSPTAAAARAEPAPPPAAVKPATEIKTGKDKVVPPRGRTAQQPKPAPRVTAQQAPRPVQQQQPQRRGPPPQRRSVDPLGWFR